ncbi:carbohydrate kinase [Pricia sp. S334]|uniref:Carbohydrate kinase n=1 Tax=Pricia mediterranea TaxID=3076079 RepID=A0ABU3L3W4_9FLAO|nr:carbohydrate kinase [Pricia sp. S334]MDT7828440.1 carbohydrate kinase [Pricia sp. S334]
MKNMEGAMKKPKRQMRAVCFGEVLFDNFPSYSKIGGALLNVCVRLKSLGMDVSMISGVGADSNGKDIIRYLIKEGVDTSGILVQKEYPTGKVNVILNDKGVASYDISYPVAWDKIPVLNTYEDLVRNSDVLVFGSLASRDAVSRSTLKSILKFAPYKVFDVNLRVPHYTYERLIDLMEESNFIKFNDEELFEIADYLGSPYNSMEQTIAFIAKETGTETICVTKGAYGAILYNKGDFYHNSGYRIKVLDTVGSGDSFLASVIYKLFNEDGPQEAINFGCAVGALVAGSEGANPILTKQGIAKFMNP